MLFFGFCLGDMGYGLILVIAGIAAAIALPKYKAYGKLIAWLGVGSLIMPLLSGTVFGMKLYDIFPMREKSLFFSDLKMFWFAIIFGLFQIVFARMIKAVFAFSKRRWDDALSEIGWCMIIIWAACAYAGSQTGSQLLPHIAAQILLFVGLVLVLFCSKPAKFFLLRPIKGIVSLYDITGIFGDMLSYIRLFGLGTTGGILALVINSRACDQLYRDEPVRHPVCRLACHSDIPHLRAPGRHGPLLPRSICPSCPSDLCRVLQERRLRRRRQSIQTIEII